MSATVTRSKLRPKIKVLLLKALRSGDFKQGHGVLRTQDDKYCCLGVLCEIVGLVGEKRLNPTCVGGKNLMVYAYGVPEDAVTQFPPCDAIAAKTGLNLREMISIGEERVSIQMYLARMNDKMGRSLLEIADWIEKNL